jgi:hypothetical protein
MVDRADARRSQSRVVGSPAIEAAGRELDSSLLRAIALIICEFRTGRYLRDDRGDTRCLIRQGDGQLAVTATSSDKTSDPRISLPSSLRQHVPQRRTFQSCGKSRPRCQAVPPRQLAAVVLNPQPARLCGV